MGRFHSRCAYDDHDVVSGGLVECGPDERHQCARDSPKPLGREFIKPLCLPSTDFDAPWFARDRTGWLGWSSWTQPSPAPSNLAAAGTLARRRRWSLTHVAQPCGWPIPAPNAARGGLVSRLHSGTPPDRYEHARWTETGTADQLTGRNAFADWTGS